MKAIIIIYCVVMMATLGNSQGLSSIKIKGNIYDAATKMPLFGEINITYKDGTSNIKITQSDPEGKFELTVLPKEFSLKVKSKGYIASNVTINPADLMMPMMIWEIPLVMQQQQQIDQIYLQSTTAKGHKIERSEQPNKSNTTHSFQAIDGISGKPIFANFKLTFTQTNKTSEFRTMPEQPSFQIIFSEKDIIAIEVSSDNYQKYMGNLIIETLDNQIHNNTPKLIKKLSVLNLILKKKQDIKQIKVVDKTSTKEANIIDLNDEENIKYGLLNSQNDYEINVSYTDGTKSLANMKAKEGINQLVIDGFKSVLIEPVFETLYFEQSTVSLKAESKQKLELIIEKMKQSPLLKIEITGHTDNTGDYKQNQYLAEFRAKYLANYLFNKGIKTERIKVNGDGSTKPKNENNTEENRSQNRRVEIRLY